MITKIVHQKDNFISRQDDLSMINQPIDQFFDTYFTRRYG